MSPAEKTSLPAVVKFQVALAVLATTITIALVLYIPTLANKKADLDQQITELTQKKKDLDAQVKSLQGQVESATTAYHSLANTTAAALGPEQAQRAIEQSLNSSPAADRILPRIFIHIRSAAQRQKAAQIASAFREQGYVVPGVQILVNEGPDETQVRYFHGEEEEAKEAAKIASALSGLKVPNVKTTLVSGYPNIRARQYEIWFSPNGL